MLKVYVVRRPDTREYKIGVSKNPLYRLGQLQWAHAVPLELVLTFDGSYGGERAMHKQFHRYRMLGEWFRESPEILEWIERVRGRIARGEMTDEPL